MNRKYRILSLLLVFVLAFSLMGSALAADEAAPFEAADYAGKLVIIHTNDAHGRDLEGVYTTAAVAQLKEDLQAAGADVLLLSAGDATQGTPLVNLGYGANAIAFMNAAGYDAMAPGNHEFDWGLDNLLTLAEAARFPILAANIVYQESGELVFADNQVFELSDGLKVGVFGLDTPETMTKAHPDKVKGITFLMEEELYACAQAQVDALEAAGCDLIVCLGHLGVDPESAPNRSEDLLAKVTGIDLFIDGHSHTEIPGGKLVGETLLVSSGEYLDNIGLVSFDGAALEATLLGSTADEEGNVTLDYTGSNAEVLAAINAANDKVEEELSAVFAKTEVLLNGERDPGVRTQETNLGDFAADALLWSAKQALGETAVDAALTNGGGIRASIEAGDVTMKTMKTVFPFGNEVATITVTGAELLEALEAATCSTPTAIGAFPQVAGMSFTIATSAAYENGELYANSTYYAPANPGARIQNLTIGGEPVDLEKSYVIATNDFTAAGGDTYGVFAGKSITKTGVALEDALVNYTREVLEGVIGEQYAEPQGRISIRPFADVLPANWYNDSVQYVYDNALMNGVGNGLFAPKTAMTRGMLVTMLYNLEGKPAVEGKASAIFSDVADDAWYADAVVWAAANDIVSGMGDGTFAPKSDLTREQMAAMIYNWADYKLITPVGAWMIQLDYSDLDTIAGWASTAVAYCKLAGIMEGADGAFNPKGSADRAMGATVLMRLNEMDKTPIERPVGAFAVTEVSKYGNLTLDMTCADFMAKGYAYGDTVTVTFGDTAITVPFVSNYSDVDNGAAAVLCRDGDAFVTVAINMGNFAGTYELAVGDTLDIELAEAGAYKDEYLIRQLTRTDVREDYASDEVFANFRAVAVGGIAEGTLYRSSSPVNPEIGRNTYADALAKAAGIKTFLNLADSEEVLTAYEGFADSYYKTVYDAGGVIALNMGVDFAAPEFREKLAEGLRFLAAAEGPVLIHCNEGKDRAGFVAALLECLMGADVEEIVGDYMLSYINYYGVEAGSEQYEAIANSNIRATLASIAGLEKGADLSGVDFVAAAEAYLKDIGLTDAEIDAIQALFAPAEAEAAA